MAYSEVIEICGFNLIDGVLSPAQTLALIEDVEALSRDESVGHIRGNGGGRVHAMRNLLSVASSVAELAHSAQIRALVEPVLGAGCFAVRSILFDKIPGANWKVVWHQDLTITVQEKRDTPGYSAWSIKDAVVHVQPPASVLESMLTVRLHLDDCFAENGPVRVLGGSHAQGRLTSQQTAHLRETLPETICESAAGGALVMRPLILHASSQAASPVHRRVVHIEYAACELPNGLEWQTRI